MNSVFIGSSALAQQVSSLSNDFAGLGSDIDNVKRSNTIALTFDVESSTTNNFVFSNDSVSISGFNDYDRFSFISELTNTGALTIVIDMFPAISVSNVLSANQVFKGALVTLTYFNGAFFVTSQINPLTGNQVAQIGKLVPDTMDVPSIGELVLDGSTLSRATHPILWAKVSATSNLISQTTKDNSPILYGGFYGTGDGVNTFTLPSYGGEFPRFIDSGRGVDSGRTIGSWQNPTNQPLQDSSSRIVGINDIGKVAGSNFGYESAVGSNGNPMSGTISRYYHITSNNIAENLSNIARSTRPRSIAVAPKIFI